MMMIVPAGRVVPCDTNEMIFGIEKMRSLLSARTMVTQRMRHSRHGALLDCLAIEFTTNLDFGQVGNSTCWDEHWAERIGRIEPL